MAIKSKSVSTPTSASTVGSELSKEQAFWNWFQEHEDCLYQLPEETVHVEAVLDLLSARMSEVHEDLTFEFGPVSADGRREFVISAGGLLVAFPHVCSVYESAPELPRWSWVKFRPRQSPLLDIEMRDRVMKAADIHYSIFKDEEPDKVGIMLFMDGYNDEEFAREETLDKSDELREIGYLFLDQALGEFDVEMFVGSIVFFNRESKYFKDAWPLSDLAAHFDEKLGRVAE